MRSMVEEMKKVSLIGVEEVTTDSDTAIRETAAQISHD